MNVDAESYSFRHYESGIINTEACSKVVGHALVAIGYAKDD